MPDNTVIQMAITIFEMKCPQHWYDFIDLAGLVMFYTTMTSLSITKDEDIIELRQQPWLVMVKLQTRLASPSPAKAVMVSPAKAASISHCH